VNDGHQTMDIIHGFATDADPVFTKVEIHLATSTA
jgi:hypothetical protein